MDRPALPPDLVARLRDALTSAGYAYDAVAALLGPTAHAALSRNETTPGLRATRDGSPLSTLVRLWLLQAPVTRDAADRALPDLVDALAATGLVDVSGDEVRAAVDVRPYADDGRSWWVLSDLTPGLDGAPIDVAPDHVLGISAASTSLAQLTVREPLATALDLGTGCGVQALHLAGHVARVVATDVNRRALAMTRLNAALNQVPVEVREGSLFEPVADERFDLVVSNPPFVVSPATEAPLVYRDSGLPGDEVVRRVVTQAPQHLTPGGRAQVLANWVHRRGEPWQDRVAGWLEGTGCDAWVVQREAADPAAYVELWLKDAGVHGRPDYARRYDAWLAWFEEQDVEAVGFGWLDLRRVDRPGVVRRGGVAVRGRAAAGARGRRAGPARRPARRHRRRGAAREPAHHPGRRAPGEPRRARRGRPGGDRAAPAARDAPRPAGGHRGGRAGRRLRRGPERRVRSSTRWRSCWGRTRRRCGAPAWTRSASWSRTVSSGSEAGTGSAHPGGGGTGLLTAGVTVSTRRHPIARALPREQDTGGEEGSIQWCRCGQHRQQAGHRRVAGQGEDDRRLPRARLHRGVLHRPHPRPAAERRRRARQDQGRVVGPARRRRRQRLHALLRGLAGQEVPHDQAQGRCSRTPTSSTSPPTRTARARPSPGTCSTS